MQINISITNASDLSEFKWNWNGTNYSFYNDSLVLMMNFNNVSAIGENNTLAIDVSKYANNGTAYINNSDGSTRGPNATGKYGRAFDFDGVDDYIEAPRSTNLEFQNEQALTIEAWIYIRSLNNMPGIVSKREGATDNSDYQLLIGEPPFWINAPSTPKLSFSFHDGAWQTNQVGNTNLSTRLNEWLHVVMIYDHDNLTAYINGVKDGNLSISTNGIKNYSSATLKIGVHPYGPQYFDGIIDEMRIWNRSL